MEANASTSRAFKMQELKLRSSTILRMNRSTFEEMVEVMTLFLPILMIVLCMKSTCHHLLLLSRLVLHRSCALTILYVF